WWTRIWVVQETVFPPTVTIVCGTVSAPWNMLSRAASQFQQHRRVCCAKAVRNIRRDYTNMLPDGRLWNTGSTQMKDTSLLSPLRRFRNRNTTDPRDKVYTLLSLVITKHKISQ
ncbi:hypothetical protein BU23DRAFT_458765, partial [Bimuria novae-zelandiae CBS 107.79]